MRWTSLGAPLALLALGCGLGNDTTAPEAATWDDHPVMSVGFDDMEMAAAVAAPTNVWTARAAMPTARTAHAVGVVNGVIYAVGGTRDNIKPLATLQAYDPATNTWVTKAALPKPRA